MSVWQTLLLPATYNGISFQVSETSFKCGRKLAIHDYPYRDMPWIEDLGLGPQEFSFRGFLNGDLAIPQADALALMCNLPGPGILTHPTQGIMSAVLLSASFINRAERGSVVELELVFRETEEFPSLFLQPVLALDRSGLVTGGVGGLLSGALGSLGSALGGLGSSIGSGLSSLGGALGFNVLGGLNAPLSQIPNAAAAGVAGSSIVVTTPTQAPIKMGAEIGIAIQKTVNGFTDEITVSLTDASRIVGLSKGLQAIAGPQYTTSRYALGKFNPTNSIINNLPTTLYKNDRVVNATTSLITKATTARGTINALISPSIQPVFAAGDIPVH